MAHQTFTADLGEHDIAAASRSLARLTPGSQMASRHPEFIDDFDHDLVFRLAQTFVPIAVTNAADPGRCSVVERKPNNRAIT